MRITAAGRLMSYAVSDVCEHRGMDEQKTLGELFAAGLIPPEEVERHEEHLGPDWRDLTHDEAIEMVRKKRDKTLGVVETINEATMTAQQRLAETRRRLAELDSD